MKICYVGKDGGQESKVWGFWLIEWKRVCSIALLCFEDGSREAYHSHAFNAVSWVLRGFLFEYLRDGTLYYHWPRLLPIWTPRDRYHKVVSEGRTWVLTFRGPWKNQWIDHDEKTGVTSTLTHGRSVVREGHAA